jgi:hypothetical protein
MITPYFAYSTDGGADQKPNDFTPTEEKPTDQQAIMDAKINALRERNLYGYAAQQLFHRWTP